MERKTYRSPAVTEVLCEFRQAPGGPWPEGVADGMHELLKDIFPLRESRQAREMRVALGFRETTQSVRMLDIDAFRDRDGSKLVQVGDRVVSVHHFRPYGGWETFRADVLRVLRAAEEVVGQLSIEGGALRYIDAVELPVGAQPDEYLAFYLIHPPNLAKRTRGFLAVSDMPSEDGYTLCRILLQGVFQEGSWKLLMDTMVALVSGAPANRKFEDWLEEAHTEAIGAFEASITDKMRQYMEVEA